MAAGERIREEREKRGWTQGDLSKHAGANRDTISGVESGRHRPRPSTLRKIAGAFGLEVQDLFEETTPYPKEAAPQPGTTQERREELRNTRELLLDSHEMLADWFDKYKADRDSRKLAAMTAITVYTIMGAVQFLAESVGPPKDRESKRVYDALARLDDLFEDIVQDLELRLEDAPEEEDVSAAVVRMHEWRRRKTA